MFDFFDVGDMNPIDVDLGYDDLLLIPQVDSTPDLDYDLDKPRAKPANVKQLLGPNGKPLTLTNPNPPQANMANAPKPGVGQRAFSAIRDTGKSFLNNQGAAATLQANRLHHMLPSDSATTRVGRFAGDALKHPAMKGFLKYAPVVGSVLSVGDVVLGDESLGNKAMDTAAMTAGGVIGSVVPGVGTALGIAGGKLLSDGVQYLFGDKKSPEQRRMEEALMALRGGQY